MILGEKSTREGGNSRVLRATGNHSYLTITLRLMLIEIFKSFFYLYMYEVFKISLILKQAIGCLSTTAIFIQRF